MVTPLSVFVSENRDPDPLGGALQQELIAGLSGRPEVELVVVPHLYDLAPGGSAVAQLKQAAGDVVLFCWLYPRAAFWVLDSHDIHGRMGRTSFLPEEEMDALPPGLDLSNERTIWCFDLRSRAEAAPYLAEIDRILAETGRLPADLAAAPPAPATHSPRRIVESAAARWYPVIDFSRCENCLECVNFCLFGVFGIDAAGRVFVESPDNCRNGCPACARVCGKKAIMFPQHPHPAVAGNGAHHDGLRPDISELFHLPQQTDLARTERDQAMRDAGRSSLGERSAEPPPAESPPNALDRLVDDVDGMEL